MEDESKSHLYLALGIVGIILFSIFVAFLIVCCERCRRRRKFRPGITIGNPVPMTLSPIKTPPGYNKGGSDEWNHLVFANRGLFTTRSNNSSERSRMLEKRPLSMPNLTDVDVLEDDNSGDYLTVQIAAILGSFPNLKYMEEDDSLGSDDDPDEVFIDDGYSKKYEVLNPVQRFEINDLKLETSDLRSIDHHIDLDNNCNKNGCPDSGDDEGPETEVDEIDILALELLLKKPDKIFEKQREKEEEKESESESESLLLLETSL